MKKFLAVLGLAGVCATLLPANIANAAPAPATCNGLRVTIRGTSGNDVLRGTNGPDVIHGGAGADFIVGNDGNDVICGGEGNDRLYGNKGNDFISGSGGFDSIWGGKGGDRLFGGSGNDLILGGPGNDRMYGKAHNDVIDGGPGGGVAYGGNGRDSCYRAVLPSGLAYCEASQLYTSSIGNPETGDLAPTDQSRDGIDGYAGGQTLNVNGKVNRRGFGCRADTRGDQAGDSCEYDFVLSRKYRTVNARVGLDDASNATDALFTYQVIGDGTVLQTIPNVPYGAIRNVNANVSGVLRLTLRITLENNVSDSVWAYWLEPRISANSRVPLASPIA